MSDNLEEKNRETAKDAVGVPDKLLLPSNLISKANSMRYSYGWADAIDIDGGMEYYKNLLRMEMRMEKNYIASDFESGANEPFGYEANGDFLYRDISE